MWQTARRSPHSGQGIDRRPSARRLNQMVSDYVVRYDSLAEEATAADKEVLDLPCGS